jgi:hypothetical protein
VLVFSPRPAEILLCAGLCGLLCLAVFLSRRFARPQNLRESASADTKAR